MPGVHGVGRYAVIVTFDDLLRVPEEKIQQYARGPHDHLDAVDAEDFFDEDDDDFFNNDNNTDNTFDDAFRPETTPGYPRRTHYEVVGSIADADVFRRAADGADALVHLAATPDDDDFMTKLLPNNVVGTYNAMEAARLGGVRRVVLASSGQVVWWQRFTGPLPISVDVQPTPRAWYACAKVFLEAAGRSYAEAHGLSVIAARLDGRFWRNGGPAGCVHGESKIQPADEELAKFKKLVEWVRLVVEKHATAEGDAESFGRALAAVQRDAASDPKKRGELPPGDRPVK